MKSLSINKLLQNLRTSVLLVLMLLLITACKGPLYTELDEGDANDMLSVLLRHGIDSEKIKENKSGLFSIHVDTSHTAVAIQILKKQGYPREKFLKVDDLFKKDGLISSPLEERVRYIYALSQDVQETLARIDGVVTARVHVVLPQNDPFRDEVKPSSASVFIKYLPDSHLEDIKSEIKLIVEKSIEGLSYDKVSVVMLPTNDAINNIQADSWKNVLGVRLPAESVFVFKTWLTILFLAVVLLAAFCWYLLWLLKKQYGVSEGWRRRYHGEDPNDASEQQEASSLLKLLDPRSSGDKKKEADYAVNQ